MFEKLSKKVGPVPSSRNRIAVGVAGGIGVLITGYIDWLTGPELAASILYLFPVGICAWLSGRTCGTLIAGLSAMVWTALDTLDGRPYSSAVMPFWNGLVRFGIFLLVSHLLALVRDLTLNLHRLVDVRTAALEAEMRQRKEVEKVVTEISSREQQRLGHELHDQLAGHLTGLAFLAKAVSESLDRRGLPEGLEARKLVEFLNQAIKQLRAFCRLLAPVESGSLEPGLSRLGAEIETAFGITCIVQTPKDPPNIGLDRARLLYSIAQEAVRRAVEKRMAKQVEISLSQVDGHLKLVVADDGMPPDAPANPQDQELGVRIMRYRAETLSGSIQVDRSPTGGSCITCLVPLQLSPESEPSKLETALP